MKSIIYNFLLFSHIGLTIFLTYWAEFEFIGIKKLLNSIFKWLLIIIILTIVKTVTIKFMIWFILFYELTFLIIFIIWCKGLIKSIINFMCLAIGLIVLNLFELVIAIIAWALKLIFNVLYRIKYILFLLLLYNFGVTPLWLFNYLNDLLQLIHTYFIYWLNDFVYWLDTGLWETYNHKYWSQRSEFLKAYLNFREWKIHSRVIYSRRALVKLLNTFVDLEAEKFNYITRRQSKYRPYFREVWYHRRARTRFVYLPDMKKKLADLDWAFNFEKLRSHFSRGTIRWALRDLILVLPKLIIRYIRFIIIRSFWYTPEKILMSYTNYDWYNFNLWYLYKYWNLLYFKLTFSIWYKFWLGLFIYWPMRLSPYIIKWYYPAREHLMVFKELINWLNIQDLTITPLKEKKYFIWFFNPDYIGFGQLLYELPLSIYNYFINDLRVDIWTIVRSYQYLIKSLKHIYILNDIINGSPISIGLLFNDIYLKSSDRFVSLTFIQPMKNYKKRDINVIKCISLIMSELYHRIRSNDKDPFYPIQWRLYYIGYILNKFYLDLVASYTRYEYWLLKGGSYFHNIRSTCKKKSFRSVRVLTLLKHKSAGSFFMMDRYQSFKARIFYYKYWLWYEQQPYYKKWFYSGICIISERTQFILNFFICWLYFYLVYNICYSSSHTAQYNLEHLWHKFRQKAKNHWDSSSNDFQWLFNKDADIARTYYADATKYIYEYDSNIRAQLGKLSYLLYENYSEFVKKGLTFFTNILSQIVHNNNINKNVWSKKKLSFKKLKDNFDRRLSFDTNKEFILKNLNNILFYKYSLNPSSFEYRRFIVDPLYSSFYYVRALEPYKLDIFLISGYKYNALVRQIYRTLIRESDELETYESTPQKNALSAKLAEDFYTYLRYFDMCIKDWNNWLKYTGAPIITYDTKRLGGNICYLAHSDIFFNEAFFFFIVCVPIMFVYFLMPVGCRFKKRKRPYGSLWGFFDMLPLAHIKWLHPIMFDHGLASDWRRQGKYVGGGYYGVRKGRKWHNMFNIMQYLSPFNNYMRAWEYYRERPGLIDIKNFYHKGLGSFYTFRNLFKIERIVPFRRMPRHYFWLFIDFIYNKTGSFFLQQVFILKIICSLLIYIYVNKLYYSNRIVLLSDTTYYWLDLHMLVSWKYANKLFIKYAKRLKK